MTLRTLLAALPLLVLFSAPLRAELPADDTELKPKLETTIGLVRSAVNNRDYAQFMANVLPADPNNTLTEAKWKKVLADPQMEKLILDMSPDVATMDAIRVFPWEKVWAIYYYADDKSFPPDVRIVAKIFKFDENKWKLFGYSKAEMKDKGTWPTKDVMLKYIEGEPTFAPANLIKKNQ